MASTSILTFEWVVTGRPERGSDQGRLSFRNSTGVDDASETTASTGATIATPLVPPNNARFMVIIPPSTNHHGLRLTGSTSEVGLPLSSQGGSAVSITTGSSYLLYTTSSTAVTGIRLIWL